MSRSRQLRDSTVDDPAPLQTVELATEAWRVMHSLFLSQRQRIPGIAAELGLTPGDMFALISLTLGEPKPMRDLAESWRCDASNVTWQVDRLEEQGLVERLPLESDRRVKQIALTKRGLKAQARVLEQMHIPPPQLVALGAEALATLVSVLTTLEVDPTEQLGTPSPQSPAIATRTHSQQTSNAATSNRRPSSDG